MPKHPLRWFAGLICLGLIALGGLWLLGSLLIPPAPGRPAFRDESLLHRLLPGLARARDLRAINKGNIRFYGKVVDQFGQPVSGAKVIGVIGYFKPLNMAPVFRNVTNVSDAGGNFAIVGQEGFSLVVTPKLAGYVLACTNTAFNFSAMSPPIHRADSNRPVVLKMWKFQGPEPLMQIEQRYRISFTNQPIHIDLVSAQLVTDGGDLSLSFARPDRLSGIENRQLWSVMIRSVQGGLMETTESRITLEAPALGYRPEVIGQCNERSGSWSGTSMQLFFHSRLGRIYGKIGLSLLINETPVELLHVEIKGVANTNSSRNWEASAPKELLP